MLEHLSSMRAPLHLHQRRQGAKLTGETPFPGREFEPFCQLFPEMAPSPEVDLPSTSLQGGMTFSACTTCGNAFSTSSHLTRHERTHSGDRPYACTTCGNAFSTSGQLTRHERTHTGERPYACTMCGKSFSQSSDLKKHRAKVHPVQHE